MISYPNAKINLGLLVRRHRDDGYHAIETVMMPAPLHDILEVIESADGQSSFSTSGLLVAGAPGDNLCIKAVSLLRSGYSFPALKLHLHKMIPMGAGLGGGSSDGAFTLKMVNELINLGISDAELGNLALQLGSDCPFFIRNDTVMAEGRGEVLTPIDLSLKGSYLVMVLPSFSISTREAYAGIVADDSRAHLRERIGEPRELWKENLHNDFEVYVLGRYPEAARIKDLLYGSGAFFAQMTGSGSVFYALYTHQPKLPEDLPGQLIYAGWI